MKATAKYSYKNTYFLINWYARQHLMFLGVMTSQYQIYTHKNIMKTKNRLVYKYNYNIGLYLTLFHGSILKM